MRKNTILKPFIKGSIFAAIVGGVFALLATFIPGKDKPEVKEDDDEQKHNQISDH